MPFLSDIFTETSDQFLADHTPGSGGPWVDHPHVNYSGSSLVIDAATDRLYGIGTDACYATATPPSADYSVSADFHHVSTIAVNIAVCARMHVTDDTHYAARLNGGTVWELRKVLATVGSTLGSSSNQLPSVGQSKRGTLVVQGNQVWFEVDGVIEIGPITDNDISAAGKAGVRSAGASSSTTGMHLDNLSADPLYASVSLFRGRNFPFFDDEEVNRFEFWPAVAVGATHERAASVSATADIATAGESFSVFERSASLAATGAIESAGQLFSVAERSVSISAVAAIGTDGLSILERAASVSATASIVSSAVSFSIFESAVTITAIGNVLVSGTFFSTIEGSALVDGVGAISTSALFFSIHERSSLINGIGAIESSGDVNPGANDHARSAAFNATGSITSNAISVLERAASLDVLAAITSDGHAITSRAVAIDASGIITSAGESFSVHERLASLSGALSVTIDGQSELHRSVLLNAIGVITATITTLPIPRGSINISRENRTIPVSSEIRSVQISRENRVQ